MKVWATISVSIAVAGACAPALAAEALPETGAAKLAAYQVCHSLAALDLGPGGSEASTECNGIVRDLDSQKVLDNLAIRCLESTSARPQAYSYSGTCVQTDGDGDKLFMTYDGSKSGQMKWTGGTGKYEGVEGSGSLGVLVAPSVAPDTFAYTLSYDVTWSHKAK